MIKIHTKTSLAFGIPGLIMHIAGQVIGQPLLFGAGMMLFIVGLAFYAKAKGRSPVWCLMGLLSFLGLILIACLKDLSPEDRQMTYAGGVSGDYKLTCPHCEQTLEAPANMLGQTTECPACNGSIVLPSSRLNAQVSVDQASSGKDGSTDESGPLPQRSQTINFKCKHCGGDASARQSNAGRMMRCSHCGKSLVIPGNTAIRPQSTYVNQPYQSQGLDRRGYWIGSGILGAFVTLISYAGPAPAIIGLLICIIGQTVIMSHRLKDIGWNRWLAIPPIGLLVAIPCLVLPTGYAAKKKLDARTKEIVIVIVGVVVLLLLGVVVGTIFS